MAKPILTVFFVEIKRGFSFLPRLFLGAVFLAAILLGTSYAISQTLYQRGERKEKAQVAICLPEEDRAAIWMISILEEMESVKDSITFQRVKTEEDAIAQLRSKEVSGAVIIPENFVSGILDATNTPARIILPRDAALTSRVVKELTKAGADTLAAAQAGIYSVDHFYRRMGKEEKIPQAEQELNQIYLDFVFPRNDMFLHKRTTATGALPTMVYFMVSGVVFFIFLWGMGCANMFSGNTAYQDKLSIYGITARHFIGIRIGVIFLLLLCTSLLLAIPAGILFQISIPIEKLLLPFCLCLWLSASYIVFLYAIGKDEISGTMLVFVTSVIMLFCAGGFVPAVFLPEGIKWFGAVLPAALCIKLLSAGLLGNMTVWLLLYFLLMSGLLYGTAVYVTENRRKAVRQ